MSTQTPPEDKVLIFDTTLRDGEQAAGATMTIDQKVEVAHQLDRLGVDIIEAGFPISSPGELASVQRIAKEVRRPIIAALSHANKNAVDAAWESLKGAARPRIHIFLSTSEIHMYHQLHKDRETILGMACEAVARARTHVSDVEFSPMDATRSDPEYLYRLLEAVIDAGASTLNIPDTVGYTSPEEFYKLIRGIFENVRNIKKARISVHCHNDLGMAVANSLAAVRAGARQVECTINGIGERAGNASLEEVVMALKTRVDTYGVGTSVDATQITRTSRLVSEHTGFAVQPNKAIVGKNAFRHASGIHQDGMLKERTTYEIMDPTTVGLSGSSLVLGKLSGRHAFQQRLSELGHALDGEALMKAFDRFKEVAEKKKEVSDLDLEALMTDQRRATTDAYSLESAHVICGTDTKPSATVRLAGPDGKAHEASAIGTGPVDAAYKAIDKIIGVEANLDEFTIQSITEGIDAIGDVMVRVESEGMTYVGRGSATDIIVASAKAYINALNRLIANKDTQQASQGAKIGP